MTASPPASRVVGVVPWLPWPLSGWRWWTEPVRAERLAALRIGLASCLLLDILLTYLPNLVTFYSPGSLGDQVIYGWLAGSPRLRWSVLHGFGDPLLSFLALCIWIGTSIWLFADLVTRALRGTGAREQDPLRQSVPLWMIAGTVMVLGIWSRLREQADELQYAWIAPLILAAMAIFLLALELLRSRRRDAALDVPSLALLGGACALTLVLLGIGVSFSTCATLEPGSAWSRLLAPWQNDPFFLNATMIAWVVATAMLVLGLWTRPAAIATWALSFSFANLNDSIDNAGDTIRGIILFYLMLCPCGAVWSLDRLWRRWRGKDAAVLYVSPWAIRLLFVQLVLIYWCNGMYKLFGGSWRQGDSLHYVLRDFTLTRFSAVDLPLPHWVTRLMTWSVLVWEVSFPVLVVIHRWTRFIALLFGVGFHLGIGLTMELGFFVPYTLCLYLPLVPWERRLVGHAAFHKNSSPAAANHDGLAVISNTESGPCPTS